MKTDYPLVDADVAADVVLDHVRVLPPEALPIDRCVGRVAAEEVRAAVDLPRWRSSAVDGYALRARDVPGSLRLIGESAAGRPFTGAVAEAAAVRILTGGVVPEGADAVVMQEQVEATDSQVTVPVAVEPRANVHVPGDDIAATEVVIRPGTVLGPAELGLAGSLGRPELAVHRRPRVSLLTTGDELVEIGREPQPGQVPDSNRVALLAALQEAGAEVASFGIAPDEPDELREVVGRALSEADVLVTSGGVSVGTHDLVKPLLESLGDVHIGRVKLKPGKPFTFATLADGKVAFGLPGFPVSSLVTFEVFVRPALRRMQGHSSLFRPTLPVVLAYDAQAPGDRTEYQRVTLKREGDELVAHTTGSQSSSRLMSLVGANALVRVPPGKEGIKKGTRVQALILALP